MTGGKLRGEGPPCNSPSDSFPGTLSKPSIWADPSPMVTKGSQVTIWCQASLEADNYYLYKDRVSEPLETLDISWDSSNKAGFSIARMTSHDIGLYRCAYQSRERQSQLSDFLPLVMTGVYRAPSLLAQPGSLVQSGDSLTLQCRSEIGFDRFALTKDEELRAPQHLEGQSSPNFPLGPVSHTHGGRYQCYSGHKLSSTWSAPSAPLGVLITGMYEKPSLSIQSGTSVSWGENVTLQCRSEIWFDTFHLSKEGSLAPPQVLRVQDTARPYQVNFILSPVTSDLEGTYRCYSSHSNYPYLLSQPSDPLELLVSSEGPQSCPLCVLMECQGGMGVRGSQVTLSGMTCLWGRHLYLYVLIGASVAFILLLGLLIFLLVRHWHFHLTPLPARYTEGGKSGLKATLHCLARSLAPQGVPSSPPQPRAFPLPRLQAAISEDPQDVTYAQLNHLALRQETSAPLPSQLGEAPDETVYAALAIH
uniref:Ig-like domain-containing protein n=1 Tax=Neovison vison TaxID=452646 RepID=A0A8C7ACD2_NEOVI